MENSVSFSRVNHKSSFIGIHCESENYGFGIKQKVDNAYSDWEYSDGEEEATLNSLDRIGSNIDQAWNDFISALLGADIPEHEIPERPDSKDNDDPREKRQKKPVFSWQVIKKLFERLSIVGEIIEYMNNASEALNRYIRELKSHERARQKWLKLANESPKLWKKYQKLKKEYEQKCG